MVAAPPLLIRYVLASAASIPSTILTALIERSASVSCFFYVLLLILGGHEGLAPGSCVLGTSAGGAANVPESLVEGDGTGSWLAEQNSYIATYVF